MGKPRTDTPEVGKPRTDAPEVGKPKTDAPEVGKPRTDVPEVGKPRTDAPEVGKPRTDAPEVGKPRTDAPEVGKPRTDTPGGGKPGIGSKVMGGIDGAGDVIDAIDKTTTYVEGAIEGDPAKMASTIVGQDTSERVRMKNAEEWAKEEGDAFEARDQEVRSELKAKLRRKGADDTEAESAMKKWDSGDREGFREDVEAIKEKGVEDTKPRGFAVDGELQEEDGIGERLTEGAKQTGKYVDAFFGGTVQRTEESVKERDGLNSEHDQTVDSMKGEMDGEIVQKLQRKGADYKEAREAVDAKNQGDSTKYNELRERVRSNEDTEKSEHAVDASGRTATYEASDYVDDAIDNVKTGAEGAGATILKPATMYNEYKDRKEAEVSREMQLESKYYKTLRENNASPSEAREAARAYAEGDPEPLHKLTSELKERKEAERQERSNQKAEKEDNSDEDWGADEPWSKGEKSSGGDLRSEEGRSPNDGKYTDWTGNTGNDLLNQMIGGIEKDRYKGSKAALDFNERQNEMRVASTSGDAAVDQADQQRDSAVQQADADHREAMNKTTDQDRADSWGSALGTGLAEGINSGAAAMGAAIASGMKAAIFNENRKDGNDSGDGGGEGAAPGEEGAAPAGGGGGGGGAPAENQVAAAPAGGGEGAKAAPAPAPAGQAAAAGGQRLPSKATGSPSGAIYCPKCGGTSFGPYEKIVGPQGQSGSDRRCLKCGHMGGNLGVPPAKTVAKATPVPKKAATATCPRCGAVTSKASNTPLCLRCCSQVALDRGMQRAAENKGQKRTPRDAQWYGVCP